MRVAVISFYENRLWDLYPTKYSLHALRLGAYIRKYRPNYHLSLSAYEMQQSSNDIAKSILTHDPQIVALPGYMWTTDKTKEVAEIIERESKDAIIVCGGPEPTSFTFLPWSNRSIFVAGQGEESLLWICDQKNNSVLFNGNNIDDDCPYPIFSEKFDREHIKLKQIGMGDRKISELPEGVPLFSDELMESLKDKSDEPFSWYETARGCIYTCSFCGHNTLPRFATFGLDHIQQEMRNMSTHGIKRIFVSDPILGGKQARGKDILRSFNALAPNVALKSYMRPEFLDDEFVDIIASGNHEEVLIGIQTTNPNVPSHVRNNDLERIRVHTYEQDYVVKHVMGGKKSSFETENGILKHLRQHGVDAQDPYHFIAEYAHNEETNVLAVGDYISGHSLLEQSRASDMDDVCHLMKAIQASLQAYSELESSQIPELKDLVPRLQAALHGFNDEASRFLTSEDVQVFFAQETPNSVVDHDCHYGNYIRATDDRLIKIDVSPMLAPSIYQPASMFLSAFLLNNLDNIAYLEKLSQYWPDCEKQQRLMITGMKLRACLGLAYFARIQLENGHTQETQRIEAKYQACFSALSCLPQI